MPQSLGALYVHLIWSTKNRTALLDPEFRPRLFEYCGGVLRKRKGVLLAANGTLDHVHILASLHRESAVADTVRDLKADSSGWIHRTFPDRTAFAWQNGYGAFTVCYFHLDTIKDYIARQEQHHGVGVTFQDEFRGFLRDHGLAWDER